MLEVARLALAAVDHAQVVVPVVVHRRPRILPVPVAVVLSASRSIPALVSMSSMVSRAASLPTPGECVTVLPSGRLMMSSAGGSAKPNAAVTVKDRSTASDSGLATVMGW